MVHARVLEACTNLPLMYTADHIVLVLPIKYMINEYGEPNTPFKLATSTKPSILNLHVLYCQYVAGKVTAHVGTKALNMRHQAQKCFRGILVGIPHHQKGYLVYVTHKQKILRSYSVIFDEGFSSALVYTSQPY